MSYAMIPVEKAILTDNEITFSALRYCLSDKVGCSVESVVNGTHTPVEYASKITKDQWKSFYNTFGTQFFDGSVKIPDDVKQSWVFDQLLQLSAFFRASQVRPNSVDDVANLMMIAMPHTLVVNEREFEFGAYSGITEFKQMANTFISSYDESLHNPKTRVITHAVIDAVGDVSSNDWLFHNPLWYKVFSNRERRLRTFRGFLYAVMVAYVTNDRYIEQVFEINRHDLIKDAEQFVALTRYEKTTKEDIIGFIRDVEYYAYDIPKQGFIATLFQFPFSVFADNHKRNYGTLYEKREVKELHPDDDKPEWKFLRDLGDEFVPELVIAADVVPYMLADNLLENNLDKAFERPIRHLCASNGTTLPRRQPKTLTWVRDAIKDSLILSLVERRLLQITDKSSDDVEEYVEDKSHILLITEDSDDERMGLSIVGPALELNIDENSESFSEKELATLDTLIWAWDKLSINKPNRMSKPWKNILKNKAIRHTLRSLMFTIIEAINISPETDFVDFMQMDRTAFFQFVDNLSEYLTNKPHTEEIADFFRGIPVLSKTIVLTEWDQYLWNAPFGAIPV